MIGWWVPCPGYSVPSVEPGGAYRLAMRNWSGVLERLPEVR